MATFSITTTPEEDAAAQRYMPEYNAQQKTLDPTWVNVTALQWAKSLVLDRVRDLVRRYTNEDKITKVEAYKLIPEGSPDKIAVDTILAKYQ
jgi:hypothetical protein